MLELRDLVVTYVKQETIVPLASSGRYVGFGIAGALLLGLGVVLLGVGGLRALQTETGETFTGDWSWAPYLIVFVALLLGGAIVVEGARSGSARTEGGADEPGSHHATRSRGPTSRRSCARSRAAPKSGADAAKGAGVAAGHRGRACSPS